MSLQAGTRLGSYEILSAIGAGGMGEVYRSGVTAGGSDSDSELDDGEVNPRRVPE